VHVHTTREPTHGTREEEDHRVNAQGSIGTSKPYRGANIASTLFATDKDGQFFTDPRWGTTNQWRKECGYVRNPEWKGRSSSFAGIKKWLWKGEGEEPEAFMTEGEAQRTTLICVWKPVTVGKDDSDDDQSSGGYTFIKLVKVFGVYNARQIAAAPALVVEARDPATQYSEAQATVDALGIDIRLGGDRACYNFVEDYIQQPLPGQFQDNENFYATEFHEIGHWTGHKSRLDREFGKRFGDDAYAMEELVAELTSVITCGALGIEGALQHHEYLASWLKRLKKDSQALFTAASKAQAAATFILTAGESAKPAVTEEVEAEAEPTEFAEAQAAA
jgi:antirestriction protein ArdC